MANGVNGGGGIGGDALTLYCRGDVRLYCGDHDCTPKSKKGRALLAILAAEQRPLSRVKLIDLLWSDRQEEQARASLRTLLADLKAQFNSRFDDLLGVERDRIALRPNVRTDLIDPALARPDGELFEGLDHIDPELDEWLRIEREKWTNGVRATATWPPVSATVRRTVLARWVLPVILMLVLVAGALLFVRPWAASEQPLIAVLKFHDITGRNQILAEGLAEQLRIELAQYPGLGVVGAQSSEADEIKGKDAKVTGRLLGASHLLEGRLLPVDGQLQLNLRLINGRSGKTVWAAGVEATGPAVIYGPTPIAPGIAMITPMAAIAARTKAVTWRPAIAPSHPARG